MTTDDYPKLIMTARKDKIANKTANTMQKMGLASVGLEMGLCVVIGYGIGAYLDSRFDSEPTLTMIFLLLGIAAGFKGLVRVGMEAKKISQQSQQSPMSKQTRTSQITSKYQARK